MWNRIVDFFAGVEPARTLAPSKRRPDMRKLSTAQFEALKEKGFRLVKVGKYAQAAEIFEKAGNEGPFEKAADGYYFAYRANMNAKNFKHAQFMAFQYGICARSPMQAKRLELDAMLHGEDWYCLQETCNELIRKHPDKAIGYSYLACYAFRLRDLTAMRQNAGQTLALDPKDAGARVLWADLEWSDGDRVIAKQLIREGLIVTPESELVQRLRIILDEEVA